jgi:hypothetical protein
VDDAAFVHHYYGQRQIVDMLSSICEARYRARLKQVLGSGTVAVPINVY